MIKYLLYLYVTINGNCKPDAVFMAGSQKELFIETSEIRIEAKRCYKYKLPTTHNYFIQGDTIFGLKYNDDVGFVVEVDMFKVINDKIVPIGGLYLTDRTCN